MRLTKHCQWIRIAHQQKRFFIAQFRQRNGWPAFAAALALALTPATLTDAQSTADSAPPRPDLIGRVQQADGGPVSATVFMDEAGPKAGTSPFCPSCYLDCRKSGRTDSQGNFKIESLDPQLLFRILVVGNGYKPKYIDQVDPGHRPLTVTLDPLNLAETPPERIIHGHIVDTKGSPIAGARVEATRAYGQDGGFVGGSIDWVDPLAVSDARGDFIITARHFFASLDLQIEAHGFSRRRFSQITGGNPSHDLQLTEGAGIHGRVTLEGKPLAGVSVGVVSENRDIDHFTGDFETETDAQGGFAFINLPPNVRYQVYGLISSLKSYGATPVTVVDAGGDGSTTEAGDLKVGTGNRINGWVVLSDGHGVPPKTRMLVGREDGWDSELVDLGRGGSFDLEGIPNGVISIGVEVEGHRFSAQNASLDEVNPFHLVGRVDHNITNLVILLEPGGLLQPKDRYYMNSEDVPELQGAEPTTDHARQRMISGRVTDKATGAPIASFRVTPGVSLLGDPYLDPSRAIDGNDGSYKFYFERKISDPALKIEAQGYLPMISGTLARGATHCDFAMTKGEPPSAVLLGDPAGARPSGLVIDVKNREENWIADDTETLEARRRAFGKVADSPAPEAGATLADTSEFVKYMSNPPWIRRMTYAHWQKYSWANKPSDPATTKWQMDTNLAGIQPSGFFEQQLSIPPAGFGRSDGGHKQICGMCDRYFWNAVESFHQVILWSGTNITWGVGREAFVQKIRHFGLPPLRPNSFTLGNDGHFSAATREGEAVHGRILEVAGSRPLALTYTVGDSTNEFTATYGYHSTNGLPSYVEFSVPVVTKKFRANVTHMASINQVEYGEDPRISAGYRPSQFFPDMAAFTKIQVFKDDGRFALDRNGTLTKISN